MIYADWLANDAVALVRELLTKEKITKTIIDELDDLEDSLSNRLRRFSGKMGLDFKASAELFKAAKGMIGAAYKAIGITHEEGMIKVAEKTVNHLQGALANKIEIDFTGKRGLGAAAIKEIAGDTLIFNNVARDWWARQADDFRERFEAQVRLGMVNNENLEDIVKRIRGTQAKNFTDGITAMPKAQAETLVRTAIVNVNNAARLATFAKNRDVIIGVQWVAKLDERTTVICEGLDGKQWTLPDDTTAYDEYEPIGGHHMVFPGPTAHWNCRSTQAPVLRELGAKKVVVAPETQKQKDAELEKTEAVMVGGTMGKLKRLGGGINDSYKTDVEGIKGVWKPKAGEVGLKEKRRIRQGIPYGEDYKREALSYEVAKVIGRTDVPITVVRDDAQGGTGSFQRFMKGKEAGDIGDWDRMYGSEKTIADVAAFDYLIGNMDRHSGNWLVELGRAADYSQDKHWLIDNGLTFPTRFDRYSGNQNYLDRAVNRGYDVPVDAMNWIHKWPEIEETIKGFHLKDEDSILLGVHERLDDLSRGEWHHRS